MTSGIEKLRLTTLHRYAVLDTEPELAFDDAARLAATACGTPLAWVGFAADDRLRVKSTVGFRLDEIPRDFALCDDALGRAGLLVVRDTLADGRYARSPLVTGGPPGVRFYAACPLVSPEGHALGLLAVAGREPRDLEPAQADALRALARQLVALLEARLTETLHRRALEHASDIIYMTDERGLFTFVNPVARRILGYDAGELLGRHYLELIRPDFRAAVEETYTRQRRLGERTTYFEFPALARDGSEVWLGQNVRLLTDGGRVTGFHAVARDIARRRRAQDALRRSEERLRQALQAAGGGVWDYDLRTETFTWSDDLYGLLGLEPGGCEPTVENWLGCVHPEDRECAKEIVGAALRSYDDLEVEYRVVLPGGAVRWLHGRGKKLTDEAGAGAGYVGVALCITARKIVEEEARRAAEYANLFRYANDAVLVIDPEGGEILDANEKASETYGLRREDLVGCRLPSISANPARELELFSGRAASGEDLEYEAEHRAGGGRPVHLLVNASFIDYRGRRAVLCINRDVTERRRAEEMLRRGEQHLFKAQRMEAVGQLAGGVAHDFNNIITGVFGFTDLALRHVEALERGGESGLTGRLREELGEVKLSGRRGADLTRQLLAFSRQQQLERRPVDVHHTVKGLLGMLRRVIEENVNIHFHPVAERSTVFADAGQIEQILVNLAANARDAMPKGGRLVIETANVTLDDAYVGRHPYARAGRYVLLSVSDTGTGMPEEVRRRVFEPFFTTKDVDEGTGLGLSTVYGIVKQHGGTIEVYSEPGRGTTFEIYLPLEAGTAGEAAEAAAAPLEGGAETVLVAEDEPSLNRLARQVLEGLGYRVVTACDGREAVKVYEAHRDRIDLVLLDVIMPRMDGPDAYREMRALTAGAAPVIFMTGYSPELVRGRLEAELGAGAGAGLLQKPYDADTLGRKVREVLDAVRGGGR
ncbi:MAG: PAS domain S-box protein [Pyrinomonadaceae bacterium]